LGEITDVICLNEIRKQGLLGYYNIILNSFIPGTTNIFMTKEQYEKIKPNLDKEMELKAIFISEEKRAKFKIYKLVE
jgi:hypothetical protein